MPRRGGSSSIPRGTRKRPQHYRPPEFTYQDYTQQQAKQPSKFVILVGRALLGVEKYVLEAAVDHKVGLGLNPTPAAVILSPRATRTAAMRAGVSFGRPRFPDGIHPVSRMPSIARRLPQRHAAESFNVEPIPYIDNGYLGLTIASDSEAGRAIVRERRSATASGLEIVPQSDLEGRISIVLGQVAVNLDPERQSNFLADLQGRLDNGQPSIGPMSVIQTPMRYIVVS